MADQQTQMGLELMDDVERKEAETEYLEKPIFMEVKEQNPLRTSSSEV